MNLINILMKLKIIYMVFNYIIAYNIYCVYKNIYEKKTIDKIRS